MGMPSRHGPMARTGTLLTTKTLHKMRLRAVGLVAGRTVKSTADRQCHHEVATLVRLEDADSVVEGLEVDSVVVLEGVVGTRLQHRFHHEMFWIAFVYSTSVRLIDL